MVAKKVIKKVATRSTPKRKIIHSTIELLDSARGNWLCMVCKKAFFETTYKQTPEDCPRCGTENKVTSLNDIEGMKDKWNEEVKRALEEAINDSGER